MSGGGMPYMQQGYQVSQGGHAAATMHPPPPTHHQMSMPPAAPPHATPNVHQAQPPLPTVVQGQQQQQQFQRLKVEDALSYLDQVKLQFGNLPQVYNDFLDIMKEFKSQTIDTPGVINRVSTLFRGHPDLIVGFNTFLPPGYKIEIQSNETINVHQPNNTILSLSTGIATANPPPHPGPAMPMPQPVNTGTSHGTPHGYHPPSSRGAAINAPGHDTAPHHTSPPNQHVPPPSHAQPPNQPVEFNHAISYVNKIKNRFQGQPEIYKSFLEILHTYQKEQRNIKEGLQPPAIAKPLTESEVFTKVAKLFQHQDDLLSEFGQFLPDGNGSSAFTGHTNLLLQSSLAADSALGGMRNDHSSTVKKPVYGSSQRQPPPVNKIGTSHLRRTANIPNAPSHLPMKKPKVNTLKDVSLAEATKYGTLNEFAFFDKVRKALRNQEVYDNFLRCLVLFNEEVVSRTELVQLAQPFLGKHADLFKWFKDFLGYKESGIIDPVPAAAVTKERVSGDLAMDIDYSSCKRYGASYRALPKSYSQPKCTGRSALCKEVLNDTWVSFPSWSEDSTFVSSRKTQFEEHIYRCEDERFELDVVLETNLSTIRILESVQKRLNRMPAEDAAKFKLDNTLGGASEVLHRKAIQRIYGDKASDIIEGLKKNPVVAVPLILRRLKAKDDEWREAQRGFNKLWREQNEKYYLKSLDHQGINFKQNDIKAIRTKALLNDVESLFDERSEQMSEGNLETGPHLTYSYKDKTIIEDAAALIIHHIKRQASFHKEDKHKIKQLLQHFLYDIFHMPRGELSDDEGEMEDDEKSDTDQKPDISKIDLDPGTKTRASAKTAAIKKSPEHANESMEDIKPTLSNGEIVDDDDKYSLFFCNNNWYLFLRLHEILCDRLYRIKLQADKIIAENNKTKEDRKESTAIALRLKTPNEVEPEDYYTYFVDMIKNVLDGNLETTSYEDILRELFGIHAYIAFTMDKIVQNIVRQLQHLALDEGCIAVNDAYQEACKDGGTGGYCGTIHQRSDVEAVYQRKVEQILQEENCFRVSVFRNDTRLTVELLDTETEPVEETIKNKRYSEYMTEYLASNECIPEDMKDILNKKPVFLPRNIRHARRMNKKVQESVNGDKNGDNTTLVPTIPPDMQIVDNTECNFNVNSFKMVYVVNSESYLYKRTALTKAKQAHSQVSLRLHKKFSDWLDVWGDAHITSPARETCKKWLMGSGEHPIKPCITECKRDNDLSKSPYYPYNRYSVKYTSSTPNKENTNTSTKTDKAAAD